MKISNILYFLQQRGLDRFNHAVRIKLSYSKNECFFEENAVAKYQLYKSNILYIINCHLSSWIQCICHIFISQKSVDKSGFVDKSGCDKSENPLYRAFEIKFISYDVNFQVVGSCAFSCSFVYFIYADFFFKLWKSHQVGLSPRVFLSP